MTDARDAWLERRRKYLTASDVAAAIGLNPFKSPRQLAFEKIYPQSSVTIDGREYLWRECAEFEIYRIDVLECNEKLIAESIARGLESGDLKEKFTPEAEEKMKWGHYAEHGTLQFFRDETGLDAFEAQKLMEVPGHQWLAATCDAFAYSPDGAGMFEKVPVELKATAYKNRRGWEVAPPDYYITQLHVQMMVLKDVPSHGYLVACFDNRCGTVKRVERDDDLIDRILKDGKVFWDCVASGQLPEVKTIKGKF